ncbi:large ribosomal subunit protein mL45-like, partial [Prorops nasuta]
MLKQYLLSGIFRKRVEVFLPLTEIDNACIIKSLQHVRYIQKHWNPKFKKERKEKFIKIDLPDFYKSDSEIDNTDLTAERNRKLYKKYGILPHAPWVEKQMIFNCTNTVFDSYIPPEGDGKVSLVSRKGAKDNIMFIQEKTKSLLTVKKIKTFDENFKASEFAYEALDVYIKAHSALT